MRLLLLGGTAWVGRAIAETAITQAHDVTCIARSAQVPAGAHFIRADRDVDDALSAATGDHWDAVVDVATHPGHVRRAVRDLNACADCYVFVSSCNVYASLAAEGIDENAPLHEPLTADAMASPEDYGPAKSACEQAVIAGFGCERSLIVRPSLIGGPGDPTGRSTYWPLRFSRPSNPHGRVLVPDSLGQPTTVLDVRDLATWIIQLIQRDARGTFNAAGDGTTLETHLETARELAGHSTSLVPAAPEWLYTQGVATWMGPRSLPLWINDHQVRGIGAISNTRARHAGLNPRPLKATLAETLAWAEREHMPTVLRAGLTDIEERMLLTELESP